MKRGTSSAYLGSSSIYPEGVSEESVPLMRLILKEPFDDSYQIYFGRLGLPVSLGVKR
jgi:hypothetical protein